MRSILFIIILVFSHMTYASHQYNLLPRACLAKDYLAFNRWSGGNTLEIVYWQDEKIMKSEVKLTENSDITMEFQCEGDAIKVEHVLRKYPSETFYKSVVDVSDLNNVKIISTKKDSSHFNSNSSIEIYGDSFKETSIQNNGFRYTIKPEYLGGNNCSPKHNVLLEITNLSNQAIKQEIIATFQKESDCH